MLPRSALGRLVPPRGAVLIQRDERPVTVGGVWIPDRTRQAARAALATIEKFAERIFTLYRKWAPAVVTMEFVGAQSWFRDYARVLERDKYRTLTAFPRFGRPAFGNPEAEWTRKLVHLGGGITCLFFPFLVESPRVVLVLAVAA